eukprot:104593-Hanusia_phi.AAC.1
MFPAVTKLQSYIRMFPHAAVTFGCSPVKLRVRVWHGETPVTVSNRPPPGPIRTPGGTTCTAGPVPPVFGESGSGPEARPGEGPGLGLRLGPCPRVTLPQ